MRVISRSRILQYAAKIDEAATDLNNWLFAAKLARWENFQAVRRQFPDVSLIRVGSGKNVACFNIRHNRYRLIVAIHHNTQLIYVLRFMTHAEYDRGIWKTKL
jgi:mRNA interferase HigB